MKDNNQDDKVRFKLNNDEIEADKGKTILDICTEKEIEIPTLCYMEKFRPEARCRICLVEMDGKLVTSCSTYPKDGSDIITENERINKARRINLELLMPEHVKSCELGDKDNEICKIVSKIKLDRIRFEPIHSYEQDLNEAIIRDDNKCINCGKCVLTCSQIMSVNAIDFVDRGFDEHISPYCNHKLHDVACIKCGQCIAACPVAAIYEREHLDEVDKALKDEKKHVVVQTAPAVRAALGEEFGYEPGTVVKGKMFSALRKLGFDTVFDTNFAADLTIMEEGSELLKRIKDGGPFPMFTSCCPGWIKFAEHFRHDILKNLSTCKSPQQMMAPLVKTYYAEKTGISRDDIVVVSIMPCTAKKFEASRPEMNNDTDYVLTTRELAKFIRLNNIDFKNLEEEEPDDPLGISTGAAAIFAATGGVMEAALRTGYELATGKQLSKLDFNDVRGLKGVKEASVDVDGMTVNVAVAHGGENIRKVLENMDKYHFIEIMACPGGCIGGGGQPWPTTDEVRQKRIDCIYDHDSEIEVRKSHENLAIKKIYEEFLGEPLGHKSHELLHTKYVERDPY